MKRLSDKDYWNSLYDQGDSPSKVLNGKLFRKRCLSTIKYNDYLLWKVILKKYLPYKKEAKVLEVGSAPGNFLVRVNAEFGYAPYGVEYTEKGVKINREIFRHHDLAPDNVISADFLSGSFQEIYKEYFDIVISRGFIEHFTHVDSIVEKHINVLAEGGYLLIGIPNLKGINNLFARFFNRKGFLTHNIQIMDEKIFSELFDRPCLKRLFCSHYGCFDFHLFNTERHSLLHFLLLLCKIIQIPFDLVALVFLRNKIPQDRHWSPYLLFIGVKKSQGSNNR